PYPKPKRSPRPGGGHEFRVHSKPVSSLSPRGEKEWTMPTTPLTVRRVPLDSLHLDPANARLHPDENLDAIAASLKRFGQAEPLVVQKGTGRVIGGNGRLSVMKRLGWQDCDVVELEID